MKKVFTFLVMLNLFFGYGQSDLRKTSLSSAGGSGSANGTYIAYAIGEIGVIEHTVNSSGLSEGFIGPDLYQILGIEDFAYLEGVKAFPNPVKNRLKISLPNPGDFEIVLFDLTGKQLLSKNIADSNQSFLDMTVFPKGVYMLNITDRKNKRTATMKIQKI